MDGSKRTSRMSSAAASASAASVPSAGANTPSKYSSRDASARSKDN